MLEFIDNLIYFLFQGVEGKYLLVKPLKDKFSARSFTIDKTLGNVMLLINTLLHMKCNVYKNVIYLFYNPSIYIKLILFLNTVHSVNMKGVYLVSVQQTCCCESHGFNYIVLHLQ